MTPETLEIPRHDGNVIRLSEQVFKGTTGIDIRHFYQDDGEWKPTKKGVRLQLEELPEIINALKDLAEKNGIEEGII